MGKVTKSIAALSDLALKTAIVGLANKLKHVAGITSEQRLIVVLKDYAEFFADIAQSSLLLLMQYEVNLKKVS